MGVALVYATLLGGSSSDSGSAIAIDSNGAAFVAGTALPHGKCDIVNSPNSKLASRAGRYGVFIITQHHDLQHRRGYEQMSVRGFICRILPGPRLYQP